MEEQVIGDNAKHPGPSAAHPNDATRIEINGVVKPGADEAVYDYFGTPPK